MKTSPSTCVHRLLHLAFSAFTLGLFAVSAAHAGLTFTVDIFRNNHGQFFNFYTPLSTNTTPPDAAVGVYRVSSPGWPTNGSTRVYEMTTNGFNNNPIDGSEHGYGDFASTMGQITNGTWTILFTNTTTTNLYTFKVNAPNMTSNMLPATVITFPSDGAINVVNQPTLTWQGPASWPVNGDANVYTYSSVDLYDSLPASQGNWIIPSALPDGVNCTFQISYRTNSTTPVFVATTPLNTNVTQEAISGWESASIIETGDSVSFAVTNPPANGITLVARYTFDNSGNLGQDTSGNGYDLNYNEGDGVMSSGTTIAGSGAASFDGNSFFAYSNTPSSILSTFAGDFSLSFWIQTTQDNGNEDGPGWAGIGLVSADVPGSYYDVIPAALDGKQIGFNTGPYDDTLNTTTNVSDGSYHHIVITRNQSTGEKQIYIDGVLNTSDSATLNPLSDPRSIAIGCKIDASQADPDNLDPSQYFEGLLDDIQIYSGILSPSQVAQLHGNPGSTATGAGGGHALVAHYDFDDSGDLGHDSSGHGNDMAREVWWGPQHEFATDAEAGGGAIQFFGTDAIFAENQALTNLNAVLAGSFTFSAWVNTTVTNGEDYNNAFYGAVIFWAYNDHSNTNDTIPLAITGSKAAFTTRGGDSGASDNLHSTTSVNDGNYHLITVTRDQATGEKKIYVDGQFETSEIGTTNPLNGNNYNLTIGGWDYYTDGTGTNYSSYNGLLDDVQIYSGVLSDTEVAALYADPGTTIPDVTGGNPNGPVVHYDFDEGTVLAADVSGNGNNIVHAGSFAGDGPATDPDAVAGTGSVYFDGGSYLTAPPALLTTLAGNFSISLWLKTGQNYGSPDDVGWQGAGVIAADSPNGGARDLIPVALTGGHVAFNVGDGNDDNTLHSYGTVNDNDVWHHIVVTRNQSTGGRQIFIDGLLDNSDFATTVLLDSPVLLTIGCKSDASISDPTSPDLHGENGYEGFLDDVQIYNRVLSSDEVAYLHNNPGAVVAVTDFNPALNTINLDWRTGGDQPWFTESTVTNNDSLAAQSGAITNGQSSYLEATVPADGQVSFYWKVSSEEGWDKLHFYINGDETNAISGEVGWTNETYSVHANDVLRWEYTKDPDCCSDGADAGWLDQVSFVPDVDVQMQISLVRNQNPNNSDQYNCFPSLLSVNITEITQHRVVSPNGLFDGTLTGSGSTTLSSLDALISECTNNQWTLYINEGDASEQVFKFNVMIAGVDTNFLKAVKILSPANGSSNVSTSAQFTWAGPAGFTGIFAKKSEAPDNNVVSTNLPGTATNWPSPPALNPGTNDFYLSYHTNNYPNITFTTPVDAVSALPIHSWSATAYLNSDATAEFVVTALPAPVQLLSAQPTGGNFQFSFVSQSSRSHAVEYRTNLTAGSNWQTYTNITGDDTLKTITLPFSLFSPAKQGFIRVSTQ